MTNISIDICYFQNYCIKQTLQRWIGYIIIFHTFKQLPLNKITDNQSTITSSTMPHKRFARIKSPTVKLESYDQLL